MLLALPYRVRSPASRSRDCAELERVTTSIKAPTTKCDYATAAECIVRRYSCAFFAVFIYSILRLARAMLSPTTSIINNKVDW